MARPSKSLWKRRVEEVKKHVAASVMAAMDAETPEMARQKIERMKTMRARSPHFVKGLAGEEEATLHVRSVSEGKTFTGTVSILKEGPEDAG